jgi:hypothetical protein
MKLSALARMIADQGARETEQSRSVETAKAPVRTSDVPMLDRLIARMEVSRTYPIPVVSILSFWPGLIALTIAERVTGAAPVTAGRFYVLAWLTIVGLELGRDVWAQRHRYASPRWLRAVEASVGHGVTVHALAELIRQHEHDPDYVVTRSDLRFAVQQERARLRDLAQRAEGFQLVEVPSIDVSQVARDGERRRLARERRAARQGRAPA